MLNGDNLDGGSLSAYQRVLILQKPGNENLYYVFIVGEGLDSNWGKLGLWYNIVDINGDNGLGEVIEKDVFITTVWDAEQKLTAVKHENKEDIWIITRKYMAVTNSSDIEHFSLSIYNRWGALIYQTNNISQGWNGTDNGEPCLLGTYVYKIAYSNATSLNATSEIKIGTVMLVR